MKQLYLITIAKTCHQANKAFCEENNDFSQVDWEAAPEWQKESCYDGVIFRLMNPLCNHSALHDNWMNQKISEGWIYGKEKNQELKTHPCLVPFEQLPIFQQKKDQLFMAIVDSLSDNT